MRYLTLLLLSGSWLFHCCLSQTVGVDNPCQQRETCSACIQTPGCCWCSKNNVKCMLASETTECSDGRECYNPVNIANVTVDKPLGADEDETVQIRPQEVYLTLRVGESYDLHLQYAQANDYPVDLYYLMDLSNSMKDDKESLSALGDNLAAAMKKLTKNFKIGFGSFVDKVAMPYVSTVPSKLKEPCLGCVSPYSFKNHLPLDTNTDEFSKKVTATSVSGNVDSPEGGFDALMQAMVCDDIGWRENARHLLVFSTDASFHLAGDGKLAGIILPNDGKCHLTDGDESFLKYDYPSISQLNQKAQQNNINLIFAVTKSQQALYMALQARIKGASSGMLDASSSNVIQLVLQQYDKLVDSVTLDNDNNEYLSVRYFTNCLNKSVDPEEVKTCKGTRVNLPVDYKVTIQVLKCPTNLAEKRQVLTIKPVSVNENLTVYVDIICECPCEMPGNEEYLESDETCHGSPSQCGVCRCDADRTGHNCECKRDDMASVSSNEGCVDANNVTCSGWGACVCGVCQCRERPNPRDVVSGKYCECDNYSCQRANNLLCGGNGECKCNKCECKPDFSGDDCACDERNCINPNTRDKCSKQGTCKCGVCNCMDSFTGIYCESTQAFPGERCEELRTCVECSAYEGNCAANCEQKVNVTLVDSVGDDAIERGIHKCYLPDNAGCTFIFTYEDRAVPPIVIHAQRTKECGAPINILAIVLGIAGGTVIIGLLSLIAWKVLTNIHDRREYVKFEKERALSKWDRGDNPLYKPSTSTFVNPSFGKSSAST